MWPVLRNFSFCLHSVVAQNAYLSSLLFLVFDWLLVSFSIYSDNVYSDNVYSDNVYSDNDSSDSGLIHIELYNEFVFSGIFWYSLDISYLYFLTQYMSISSKINHGSFNFNLTQLDNNNFYIFNSNNSIHSVTQTYLYGLRSIWSHVSLWVLPVVVAVLFFYYSFFLNSLPFSNIMFGYILLGNMFYLLVSGFVFFINKYQYSLYTSSIQSFWSSTLIIFWAIEGSLFVCFLYLILNANQEPVYVYDNIQLYNTHFYSWSYFLLNIMLSSLLIILTYMLLLSVKWNTFTNTNNISLLITVVLLYVSWLEFYQFFHLMNCYGTSNWVYDFSEHLWNLELEFNRTSIVNHYVTIGLIAKFWHIVFAVVFWIFFILSGVESTSYSYPLLSANLQNFLIIYIMSWLYMYPWFNYTISNAMDMPYFWFFVNNSSLGVFLFFNDIKLYWWGFVDLLFNLNPLYSYNNTSYFYWHESCLSIGNTQFSNHNISDLFISNIN